MRCTERRLIPTDFAMARPVQCVTCPGGSEQVSARISPRSPLPALPCPAGVFCHAASLPRPLRHTALASAIPPGGLPRLGGPPRPRSTPSSTTEQSGHVGCVSAGDSGPSQSMTTASDRHHQRRRKLFEPSSQSGRTAQPCERQCTSASPRFLNGRPAWLKPCPFGQHLPTLSSGAIRRFGEASHNLQLVRSAERLL